MASMLNTIWLIITALAFDGDEAIVRQLVSVFLRDHQRTITDLQRAAAHLGVKPRGGCPAWRFAASSGSRHRDVQRR